MIRTRIAVALVLLMLPFAAIGQIAQTQPRPTTNGLIGHPQSLSLQQLYRHFLLYQNHLDLKAAAVTGGQGPSLQGLRNHMQVSLGFSSADYAPIHASAARLATEIQTLENQAAAIKSSTPSPAASSQLIALAAQRDTSTLAEITYLRHALPPAKIKELESFLVTHFSIQNAALRPSTIPPQAAKPAVQP